MNQPHQKRDLWKPLGLSLLGLTGGLFLLGSVALGIAQSNPAPGAVVPSVAQIEVQYMGLPVGASISVDGHPIPTQTQLARFRVVGQPPALDEGEHLAALDISTALRRYHKEWKFCVDSTRPRIHVQSPAPDSAVATSDLQLTGKCELESTVAQMQGETRVQSVPVDPRGHFMLELKLEPGWNEISLLAQDRAGNLDSKKLRVFSDREAPTAHIQLVDGKDDPVKADGATLAHSKGKLVVEATDDGGLADCKITVDGRPRKVTGRDQKDGQATFEVALDDLSEGDRTVTCQVTDRAGRCNNTTAIFNVDSSEKFGERPMTAGARGQDVEMLQERLVDLKLLTSEQVSQVLDPETVEAVKKFQKDQGMKPDGVVGRATLGALGPRIYVNLAECALVLDRPGMPLKRYGIACGMPAYPTPTGSFRIMDKEKNPTWMPPDSAWAKEAKVTPPGPGNPLGTRWIGLDSGVVGIHGTNADYSIGSHASHGCIRMHIPDVEELYEMVEPGTPVEILAGNENLESRKKYWP